MIIVITISLVLIAASLIALCRLVFISSRSKRIELSMETILNVRMQYKNLHNELSKTVKFEDLNHDIIRKLETERLDVFLKVRDLLGLFENLATSINMGIIDFEYVARTSKMYMIKVYDRWEPFMQYRIDKEGNQKLYCEFKAFIEKLKKSKI